jgi:hypothetical protein
VTKQELIVRREILLEGVSQLTLLTRFLRKQGFGAQAQAAEAMRLIERLMAVQKEIEEHEGD